MSLVTNEFGQLEPSHEMGRLADLIGHVIFQAANGRLGKGRRRPIMHLVFVEDGSKAPAHPVLAPGEIYESPISSAIYAAQAWRMQDMPSEPVALSLALADCVETLGSRLVTHIEIDAGPDWDAACHRMRAVMHGEALEKAMTPWARHAGTGLAARVYLRMDALRGCSLFAVVRDSEQQERKLELDDSNLIGLASGARKLPRKLPRITWLSDHEFAIPMTQWEQLRWDIEKGSGYAAGEMPPVRDILEQLGVEVCDEAWLDEPPKS
ncbi:MAG: hypothetical protein KDC95_01895 [Planctomycetes bacterium]|nr:hypothetical protein [Planctomycetota bacterium]